LLYQQTTSVPRTADFNLFTRTSRDFEYCVVGPDHPRRAETERFISECFTTAHDAHITNYMNQLIAITDADGVIKSAVGVRDAGMSQLFLEHYLDIPVEKAIADHTAKHQPQATRGQIVEVGNLASTDRTASRRLFEYLAAYLIQMDYRWVVFTGCHSLRQIFKRMHIELVSLGKADQFRLPRELGSWGRYYDNNPQVMAGPIAGALALVQKTCTGIQRVAV